MADDRALTAVPVAREQEADVLGTCLAEGLPWWRRVEHLMEGVGAEGVAELFYEPDHHMVARAMASVAEAGGALSIPSVADALLARPDGAADRLVPDVLTYLTHLQSRGAIRDLGELTSTVDVLNQKLQLRNQLRALETQLTLIKRDQPHPNEVSAQLRTIAANAAVSEETQTFGERIRDLKARESLGVSHRLRTGLAELDELIRGGMEPTRMFVVGARPKVGKTLILLNMALEALAQDAVVVFASLEIGERELHSKLLAAQSAVDQNQIQAWIDGKRPWRDFEVEEQDRITTAEGELDTADLYTLFAGDLNHGADSIIARTMRIIQRHPGRPVLILVDYLQLLVDDAFNRAALIGQVSRKLKVFAIEMNLTVVLASQINREQREGGEGMPTPNMLRESGAIEQDADVVMLLNRPHLQDEAQPAHIMDLWLALNRYGTPGRIKAAYLPHIQTVTNMEAIWGAPAAAEEPPPYEERRAAPRERDRDEEEAEERPRRRRSRYDDEAEEPSRVRVAARRGVVADEEDLD